jgi:hypothetical protein
MMKNEKDKAAAASGGGQSRKAIRQDIEASALTAKELLRLPSDEIIKRLNLVNANKRYVQTVTERVGRKRLGEENSRTIDKIINLLKAEFPSVFVMHKTLLGQEGFIVFPDGEPGGGEA